MRSNDVHARRARSMTPSLYLPLRRLALCLDCEACFEIGAPSCLACGGDTWVPLAKFLDQEPLRVVPQFRPLFKSRTEDRNHRGGASERAAKQILLVANDQQKLYEYLRRAFAGNRSVEVILDRRRAARRTTDQPRIPERRRGDRRLTLEVDEHLRAHGWAVVRLDVFKTLQMPSPAASD